MNRTPWLFISLILACAGPLRAADDWQLFRHEGRDYVALENVAKFYGFAPPPPVVVTPGKPPAFAPIAGANSAPAPTGESPATDSTAEQPASPNLVVAQAPAPTNAPSAPPSASAMTPATIVETAPAAVP